MKEEIALYREGKRMRAWTTRSFMDEMGGEKKIVQSIFMLCVSEWGFLCEGVIIEIADDPEGARDAYHSRKGVAS